MRSGSTAEGARSASGVAPRRRVLPPPAAPTACGSPPEAGPPHGDAARAARRPGSAEHRWSDPDQSSADARDRPGVLVIGLGNPLLGDDAVGWRVVEELERVLDAAGADAGAPDAGATDAGARAAGCVPVETDFLAVGGIGLMERIAGAGRVVLVDAIETGTAPPGTVVRTRLSEIPIRASTHLDGAHDMPLPAALEAGRALGAAIPDDITVVAIEAVRTDVFSDALTPPVAAAVPGAVRAILTAIADG